MLYLRNLRTIKSNTTSVCSLNDGYKENIINIELIIHYNFAKILNSY